MRQFFDKFLCVRCADSGPHFFVGGIQAAVEYIFFDGGIEEERILWHHADVVTERAYSHIADVFAVDENRAAGDVIEAGQEVCDGGLAGTGGAYHSNGLAGLGYEIQICEHRIFRFIGESHMAHFHFAGFHLERLGLFFVLHFRLFVENRKDAIRCRQGFLDVAEAFGQAAGRVRQIDGVNQEGHELAGGHHIINDRHTAVPNDGTHRDGGKEFYERRHLALLTNGADRGLEALAVDFIETLFFIIAAIEASDDTDGLDGFLENRGHIG